ncbi:exocyst complex component SEC8-like [Chenopodium quinoa]|uniref:exocyst complex component SEC8-like n=1 Tax=Chenopodium quinoa TaxID=63459 RepID=UPI000B7815B6|nr:exocyst complex component SEC8-like [Chenopodium quinoa]
MGLFDGLPVPSDKAHLREDLARIDESWAAARFDSLPHVVRLLTAKDELQALKEQSEVIEDVVDEVVHAYHSGFNRAIQNYSQILRLFSESEESISVLKVDLAEAKKRLGARNKQLHQFWYRSVTLRHIISLLDQIEGISKVPARMEKLIAEKQFYAAVQLHVQSTLMLEREGLQTVGALQDVKSELTKLRGVLFYKILEDLHAHLYNKGDYSSVSSSLLEKDDEVIMSATLSLSMSISQPVSRRTRSSKSDYQVDGGSYDGHDEEGGLRGEVADGHVRANGGDYGLKKGGFFSSRLPPWLSSATPDEFLEAVQKSDAPLHVKYLQTMVECLCKLGKVAAAGAMICQRLRSTIHEIISSKIKAHAENMSSSRPGSGLTAYSSTLHTLKGQLETYQLSKQKRANGVSLSGTLLAVSPVTPVMAPMGTAQAAARELLNSILDAIIKIFENHVIVGELLEAKASQQADINTPRSLVDVSFNTESEVTGGYSIGFSLTVLQSECQQLICEILRATPEAASADAAVQTARLAGKVPSKEKRDGSDDGLTFAFRFSDATMSVPNQGQSWNKKAQGMSQEGYGSAAVLPEEGMYLAAAVYRPVLQFTDKVASMLPENYSQSGNDGLLAFVENFVKEHFLPTMFVDYRKSVQQAISSPAAFRPRTHAAASYTPSVEKGRPVLQGLLAIDLLTKEILGWAQAMPKFAAEFVKYVQTFLERAYERCRTSYMEAVLEKQSYMLIGRHDIESLMKLDPASSCLQNRLNDNPSDAYGIEVEKQMSEVLLSLRPIKQENLIRDDNKLILLASVSDSLEYVADSIERLGKTFSTACNQVEEKGINQRTPRRSEVSSSPSKDLVSFADDYRKLAIDCLKVLRVEMQLETVFHMQEMTNREYLDDLDAEEPDDFIISLTAQITRRDEAIAPFVSRIKQNYIFGGICGVTSNASIKALADMKSINLFGVQQICRNSIALEQALAAIPSIDSEAVQLRLDRVRTYFELLNMPFEALLAFITEHENLFTPEEYANLLKIEVPGREIPADAQDRVSDILR